MLNKWKQRRGHQATYRELAKSLHDANAINSLHILCQVLGAQAAAQQPPVQQPPVQQPPVQQPPVQQPAVQQQLAQEQAQEEGKLIYDNVFPHENTFSCGARKAIY